MAWAPGCDTKWAAWLRAGFGLAREHHGLVRGEEAQEQTRQGLRALGASGDGDGERQEQEEEADGGTVLTHVQHLREAACALVGRIGTQNGEVKRMQAVQGRPGGEV